MQKILKTQEDVLTNAIRKKVVQSPSPPPHASNSVWLEITNFMMSLYTETDRWRQFLSKYKINLYIKDVIIVNKEAC